MNAILAIPLPLRLLALFVLGSVAGSLINLAAYTLAWHRRSISPWSVPAPGARSRHLSDRIPILGWWGLKRESPLHGRGFWVRPMLVELATGSLFAAIYYLDTERVVHVLIPNGAAPPAPETLCDNLPLVSQVRYLGHILLISLMLAASLIDIDEKTIPDAITVPGVWLGLLLASGFAWVLPSAGVWAIGPVKYDEFLSISSPAPWPGNVMGPGHRLPWGIALVCWTVWCGGLLPRRFNTRRGWTMAVRVFLHRLRVEAITYWIALMWIVGAGAISLSVWLIPASNWAGLLSSLVGMAIGGGVIWLVRVVGGAVLGREAMGFGDVTLMSMVGTFVGWQPTVVIFFLAPFLGLAIAIGMWVVHREHEIPYGPFLCLAALVSLVAWPTVWESTARYFELGWLLALLLAICMVLLGAMLFVYRIVRDLLSGPR